MKEKQSQMLVVILLTVLLFALFIYAGRISYNNQDLQQQNQELANSIQQLKQNTEKADETKQRLLNQEEALKQNTPEKVLAVARKFAPLFLQPLTQQNAKQLRDLSTANMSQAFTDPATITPKTTFEVASLQLHYAKTDYDQADVFVSADIQTAQSQAPIREHLEMKLVYDSTKKRWLVDDMKIQLPVANTPKGTQN